VKKLLPVALVGGAVAVLRNSKARERLMEVGGQAMSKLQGLLHRGEDERQLPVAQYRTTNTGDVETEDQGGSWADDGGGGHGGGQASPAPGSTPLPPNH
jgi:hypothetical protein